MLSKSFQSVFVSTCLMILLIAHTSVGFNDPGDDDLDFNLDADDFLDSLSSMADMLSSLGGDDNDACQYHCKNGAIPEAKKGHIAKSNGCGAYGLELDTSNMPGASACCDKHDYCYHTCNMDKVTCDHDFRDCLNLACDKMKGKDDVIDGCYTTAELMYTGTMTLGCKPYKDSQKDACSCDRGREEL